MTEIATALDAVSHRYPFIITTTGFLNDTLQFTSDIRFNRISALLDTNSSNSHVFRDEAEFAVVDIGIDKPQLYTVETFATTYTRDNFNKVFK